MLAVVGPGDGEAKASIRSVSELPEAEVEQWEAAVARLNWATNKSPFVAFERRWKDLQELVDPVGLEVNFSTEVSDRYEAACEALDAMLSAARAFMDRTAHRLSSVYGKGAPALRSFRRAQAREFDGEFAYRFCEKLRNYSQHCGHALSNIRASTRLGPNDERITEFVPVFDADRLIAEYDGWGRRVRGELEQVGGTFEAMPVLERFYHSCVRTNSVAILVQEADLRASVRQVADLADQARDIPGEPMIMRFKPATSADEAPGIQLRRLGRHLAEHVEALIDECNAFVGEPWPPLWPTRCDPA